MRRETIDELKQFPSTARHPHPFATPVMALSVAAVIAVTASYAHYLRGNVFEMLDKDHRVNDFEYIVSHTTLKESFEENAWEYTVVAPTDQAFDKAQWQSAALTQGVASAPQSQPAYHNISAYDYVVSSPITPDEVTFGNHVRVPSLSGQDLVFSRVSDGEDGLRVNGMPVQTVHTANNGVIYLIDDIIPFPEQEQQLTRNTAM